MSHRGGVPDPVAVLRGHSGEVQALCFDESEHLLFTGDANGEVRVWDLQDMRPVAVQRLHTPTAGVLSLHLLGARQLLSQGRDGVVHLWDLDTGLRPSEQPVRSFIQASYSFCRCSLLLPKRAALSTSSSAEVSGQQEAEPDIAAELLAGPAEDGSGPSSPGSRTQAAVHEPVAGQGGLDQEGTAAAASSSSCQPALLCSGHACPAATADGQQPALLALADDDAQDAEVWCCACGQRLAHLRQAEASTTKLGMLLSVCLYRWQPEQPRQRAEQEQPEQRQGQQQQQPGEQPEQPARHAGSGPPPAAGVYLAAGYEDGSVVVWDLTSSAPQPLAHRKLFAEPVMALGMAPRGGSGVAGAADTRIVCFSVDYERRALVVRHTIDLKRQGVCDVVVRQDGRLLATAGWDGRVRLYKYRSGRALAMLKASGGGGKGGRYHSAAVTALAFSSRTLQLATAARDGTVALWDVYQPGSAE